MYTPGSQVLVPPDAAKQGKVTLLGVCDSSRYWRKTRTDIWWMSSFLSVHIVHPF